jgi:peptidyl-prolyl cis-trans isomerase A (cyclophilin A)
MKKLITATLVLCLPCVLVTTVAAQDASSGPMETAEEYTPSPLLKPGWYVRIETNQGRIVAQLLPQQAPQSVAHFVGLARGTLEWTDMVSGETKRTPYYDGMPVHRVIAGRAFEAGDAAFRGQSTPMLYVPMEGLAPVNFSRPYAMGMMNLGQGRWSGSVFFITASAQPWLNGTAPCFGAVVEGTEVVFNISQAKADENGRPLEPVVIEKMDIFSVGNPDPIPEPEVYKPKRIDMEFAGDDEPTTP